MVRFVYNLLQNLLILLLWPVGLLLVLSKEKYRIRFWGRCGFGLRRQMQDMGGATRRFWVHALSVGELSSVVSLVKALRKTYPDAAIVLSSSTTGGMLYAKTRLEGVVDGFIEFPYDHFLIARYFVSVVRPDLYIQVETDFWPNFLAEMKKSSAASFLVNGRISIQSFRNYQKYPSLFLPLFNSFTCLGMQTAADVQRMQELGVASEKITVPGNLKIDAAMPEWQPEEKVVAPVFPFKRVIVFGSTHPGEEEELASVLAGVKKAWADVCFVVAPRDISRGQEVAGIFNNHGLSSCLWSRCPTIDSEIDCLIVDTMGELVSFYKQADIAFIGGSLKPFGGHNPLEPAAYGKPVIFGPHMEDFEDICDEMLAEECAVQVSDKIMLGQEICGLLKDRDQCKKSGQAALEYILKRQGVTKRHLDIVARLLES